MTSSSSTAPPTRTVSKATLYRRLRSEELKAYCHVLRAFIGQGLTLDSSRLRMLSDLRDMLCITDMRHASELAASSADQHLLSIAQHQIHSNRASFVDPISSPLDNGEETEDDGDLKSNRRKKHGHMQRQSSAKRPRVDVAPADVKADHVQNTADPYARNTSQPKESLEKMSQKMAALQAETNLLQQQLQDAVGDVRKKSIKAKLDARLKDLEDIITQLGEDDDEADEPVEETSVVPQPLSAGISYAAVSNEVCDEEDDEEEEENIQDVDILGGMIEPDGQVAADTAHRCADTDGASSDVDEAQTLLEDVIGGQLFSTT